jgi:hypothetical protein
MAMFIVMLFLRKFCYEVKVDVDNPNLKAVALPFTRVVRGGCYIEADALSRSFSIHHMKQEEWIVMSIPHSPSIQMLVEG